MDPLSITTTVLGITARCLTTAKLLYGLRQKYKNASLTITAMYSESTVIGVSLSRIQSLVLKNQESISENLQAQPELESTFDTALTGCVLVYSVLDVEVQRLSASSDTVTGKIDVIWNEETMKDILQQIRGQQIALSLLIQMLSFKVLSKVSNDVRQLRRSNPRVRAPSSILEMPLEDFQSISTARYSTTFDFDNQIVDTAAYRRAIIDHPQPLARVDEQYRETPKANVDSRLEVLQSVLREREEQNFDFREQISKLSRENSLLLNKSKAREAANASQTAMIKSFEKRSNDINRELESEKKRNEKLMEKSQRLETALKGDSTSILGRLINQGQSKEKRVFFFAGLNQEDAADACFRAKLISLSTTVLIVNEETEDATYSNLIKSLIFLRQNIELENIALITGGPSLTHCRERVSRSPFSELLGRCEIVVLWHDGPSSLALSDFMKRVSLVDVM